MSRPTRHPAGRSRTARSLPRRAAAALALALVLGAPGRLRAQPAAGEGPGPADRPRVQAVELALPEGEDRGAAAALLSVRPGDALSARALHLSVQRLYETGRFRSVVVRSFAAVPPPGEGGAWVRLVVEAQAQRRIGRLTLRSVGPSVLPDTTLRAVARLAPGDPFDDADLQAAAERLRAALARKGYRRALVETSTQGEASVAVELAVTRGEPTRVREVRLPGAAGPAAAGARLSTRPGAVLDEDHLAEDATALRAALHSAGYRRARVGAAQVAERDDGALVSFPVTMGPRVAVVFRGNAVLPAALLVREMGIEPDQPLDTMAVDAAVERLRAAYRAHGFAAAQVDAEEVPRGGDLAVVFRIVEGRRYRVGELRFEGAEARTPAQLRAQLLAELAQDRGKPETPDADAARMLAASLPTAPARPAAPPPLPSGEFYEEAAWDRAAERIADDYRAAGWLEAIYLGATVSLDEARRTVDVVVRLREGPRTTVGALIFEGQEALSEEELRGLARLSAGDPLAYERVEETRSAILRRYAAQGRVFARVEAREQLDAERHVATLRFVIEEGPEVHVGRVVVTGNRRTREDLIRRNVELREGDRYDPEAAARSQAALLDTGVFRAVDLRLQDPEVPQETKDVLVDLSERPYATLTQAIGYSIANGPRLTLEYVRPNLLGRALELSLRGKVNYPTNTLGMRPDLADSKPADRVEGQVDAGLRTARLAILPFPAAGRLNLIGELVHRPAYNLRRVSGVAGIDVGVTTRSTFSLQYELEVDDIDRTGAAGHLTQVDLERLRFDEGTTTLHAIRPSFALDHRDNATHPHRGWFLAGAAEYEHSLGGPGERGLLGVLPGSGIHTNLLKLSGGLSGYLPLPGNVVLALAARGGQVVPLDGRSRTIVPRRFFLGGASTLRGFGEEQLVQQDVRDQLAAEGRACATSPTGEGCTENGRRVASGSLPVSEGGEAFVLGKAELRLPVTARLELGLFLDFGNLWLDPTKVNARELRPCAGAGARFVTPIGPAALDVGTNLDRDTRINEEVYAVHFTIGLF